MAWLKGQQPAAKKMRELFDSAGRHECILVMNIVNLGEIFYLSAKARDTAFGENVIQSLLLSITTVSAGDELVMSAANLKSRNAISYADAFAAATAMSRQCPLATGDPELRLMLGRERTLQLEWVGA